MNFSSLVLVLIISSSVESSAPVDSSSFNKTILPPVSPSTPLKSYGMLYSHDAGTGYIEIPKLINPNYGFYAYAKTQTATLYGQLKVGARGLGIRVTEDESGDLVFTHGVVDVPDVTFVGAMTDVVTFAAENPEELIVVTMRSTNVTLANEKLSQLGIPVLNGAQVDEAATVGGVMSAIGGNIFAVYDMSYVKQNYIDPLVGCYADVFEQPCTDANYSSAPFEALSLYTDDTANGPPVNDDDEESGTLGPGGSDWAFWKNQGIWQTTPSAIKGGLAAFSTIINDNQESGVNGYLAGKIEAGDYDEINLFVLNDILDEGARVAVAIREHTLLQYPIPTHSPSESPSEGPTGMPSAGPTATPTSSAPPSHQRVSGAAVSLFFSSFTFALILY